MFKFREGRIIKNIQNLLRLTLVVLFAATLLTNLSCHKESHKVNMGGLFSITGNWATLGVASRAALQIAIEDINDFYRGNDRNVVFTSSVKDTLLEPDLALALLEEFSDSGTNLIIVPMSSAEVSVVKNFADNNDIVIVSQSSTAGSLSIAGDNIFRFSPDDSQEGAAVAELMLHDGIDSIVPISRDDAGNEGLNIATTSFFMDAGGNVTESIKYAPNTMDFSDIVEKLSDLVSEQLEEHDADQVAVYLAGFDEVVEIFKLAKDDSVLSTVKWYGSDGVVFSQALLTNEGDSSEFAQSVIYPNPIFGLNDDMENVWGPVADEITERTGVVPDAFALSVYDIAWALARAYLNTENPKDIEAFKDEFVLAAKELDGITGSTELNEAGDRKFANFDFWGVREENEIFIWKKVGFFDASNNQITDFE
ncbi:MAG: ABC transporter substrate-binding protein [Candidatus Dadabacteria bacterium]|nr:ABC transporter substrate-binding protein [Candidatus Dadabacteria bacterium]NIX14986.1 ABC transporter substrate-binding protein [Candidatus Dadabacteria bacterium]